MSAMLFLPPKVGGQCEIVLDFKPKELGPFHEARGHGGTACSGSDEGHHTPNMGEKDSAFWRVL